MIRIESKPKRLTYLATTGAVCLLIIASLCAAPDALTPPNKEEYRRFAMLLEGDVARGKQLHDKRQDLKKKDAEREIRRALNQRRRG